MKGVVLVTGTTSGIGRETARLLGAEGWTTFGGTLDPDGDPPLPGVSPLFLDVRDDQAVRACVDEVLARAGRLDAVVNNAGYALFGAVEETSLEEARAQLEVNFYGAVRVLQAALPHMRAAGRGRIVNVTSGAGLTAEPYAGYYTASKFALEGLSEALAHEVEPFGVRVTLIEPGWFRTAIARNRIHVAETVAAYDPVRPELERLVTDYVAQGADPRRVARAVRRVLRQRRPPLRVQVGTDVGTSFWLRRLLPERLFQRLVAQYYRL